MYCGQIRGARAVPLRLTVGIARAAVAAGVHYLDLTEDVGSTRQSKMLAAGPTMRPRSGFISIVAHHLTAGFDRVDAVRLRTGALPEYPANARCRQSDLEHRWGDQPIASLAR